MPFIAWANSIDPDQLAHTYQLNQTANSADSDQTAWMCRLIWIYAVRVHVYMEERVNFMLLYLTK
jgi:hypothetical protein